jgi:hypothetical protein
MQTTCKSRIRRDFARAESRSSLRRISRIVQGLDGTSGTWTRAQTIDATTLASIAAIARHLTQFTVITPPANAGTNVAASPSKPYEKGEGPRRR